MATDQARPGAETPTTDPLEHASACRLSELRRTFLPSVAAARAVAGLYVPSFHPGHREHELTQKIRRSKTSREHDLEFAELLAATLRWRLPGLWPELVVSIPPRPGERDRFKRIRAELAARIGTAEAGRALWQTRGVEGYRQMTTPQRIAASAGRFEAQPGVCGKSVLLIDDVITSGAQTHDAIRALKAAGAARVRVLALAGVAPERAHGRPDLDGSSPGRSRTITR